MQKPLGVEPMLTDLDILGRSEADLGILVFSKFFPEIMPII